MRTFKIHKINTKGEIVDIQLEEFPVGFMIPMNKLDKNLLGCLGPGSEILVEGKTGEAEIDLWGFEKLKGIYIGTPEKHEVLYKGTSRYI